MQKYFCDHCEKEVADAFMLFPIKFKTPNGEIYVKELCGSCVTALQWWVTHYIKDKPCDAVISNE